MALLYVYYKYIHGSFNINNEIYYLKNILHNINFVKMIIRRPKNQIWYPKLNVPCFWNNYIVCIIILNPKMPQKRVTIMCLHLLQTFYSYCPISTTLVGPLVALPTTCNTLGSFPLLFIVCNTLHSFIVSVYHL